MRLAPAVVLALCLSSAAATCAPQDPAGADDTFVILELMGSGSTLRQGPHRQRIRLAVMALRERQDQAGWFAPAASPTRERDQAIATLAMAETWLGSHYALLRKNVLSGASALAAALEEGPAFSTEVAALGDLLLACLRSGADPAVDDAKRRLEAALRRVPRPPSTPAEIAAEHLLRRLRALPAPAGFDASRLWPTPPDSDPLATFYLELADYRPEDPAWGKVSEEREKARKVGRDDKESPQWHTSLRALAEQLCRRACKLLCVPKR